MEEKAMDKLHYLHKGIGHGHSSVYWATHYSYQHQILQLKVTKHNFKTNAPQTLFPEII